MNSTPTGWSQPILDEFIMLTEAFNLGNAMNTMKISVIGISANDDAYQYLVSNLVWPASVLLMRWVSEYRTTGNFPTYGLESADF